MAKFYKEKYFLTHDNCKINYIDEGKENPNTILFLHAWSRRGNSFRKIGQELVKNNRVVWLDYRGHGKTKAKNSFTIETLANDVHELINYLNLKNITIIGYSLGAFVMFQYLKDFGSINIDKAMIIDMSPKLLNNKDWSYGLYQGNYSQVDYEKDLLLIKNNPSKFLSFFYSQAMPEHTSHESRDYEVTLLFKVLGRFMLNKKFLPFWEEMISADYRKDLSNINIPVAIVYARPGSLYTEHAALYMHSELQNSKLYPFDDSTHTNISFKTTELLNVINDFNLIYL